MSVAKKPPIKLPAKPASEAKPAAPKKIGRPSEYRQDIADKFCAAIAQDEASIAQICKRPGMPSVPTIFKWMRGNESFLNDYARAREMQAESGSHRMREIEENVITGKLDPNAARVVLDSIKWRASKLAPKKYGDKLQLEATVEDVTAKSTEELLVMVSTGFASLPKDQLATIMASLPAPADDK